MIEFINYAGKKVTHNMNKITKLNELLKQNWQEKYSLYKDLNAPIIDEALKLCDIENKSANDTTSIRLGLARRLVDLKFEPIENELKKLNYDKNKIKNIKAELFKLTLKFNLSNHENFIQKAKSEQLLSGFSAVLVQAVHEIGKAINAWQIAWQAHIIDDINKELSDKFKGLNEAINYLNQNGLFMPDKTGKKSDRAYAALVRNGDKYELKPYALAFKDEFKAIDNEFKIAIKGMNDNINEPDELISDDDKMAYLDYFKALRTAFGCTDINALLNTWQDTERAWMRVKAPLQVGHPLEYYEDAYMHAVAPEWDLRLSSGAEIDEDKFKSQMIQSFEYFYQKLGANDNKMKEQVIENIKRTQLYIGAPMLFYGAELDGLFSAQVVPNDETVSGECGKKIFAFTSHIRMAGLARPFMRLSAEIFPAEFLQFNRRILFTRPALWKAVYNASTIGHEFGHILFIGTDTEQSMNASGEFKFIEEFKATSGGLINFFLNDKEASGELRIAVFAELIARAVGLIAWKNVAEVRAYYCEGLIHLSMLFASGAIKFNGTSLEVDISAVAYGRFKELCLSTYLSLAKHYLQKEDAGKWLANYCVKDGETYMPKETLVASFVKYYYARYEIIGGEIDKSDAYAKFSAQAINE